MRDCRKLQFLVLEVMGLTPTDAAGGYCDGNTGKHLRQQGVDIYESLQNNDAYSALEKCDGLIFTYPTGTNVNDVAVVL